MLSLGSINWKGSVSSREPNINTVAVVVVVVVVAVRVPYLTTLDKRNISQNFLVSYNTLTGTGDNTSKTLSKPKPTGTT